MNIITEKIRTQQINFGKIIRKTNKTIVVEIRKQVRHKKYSKILNVILKYMVHNPENRYSIGDIVRIKPSRPYSKRKKWIII